MSIKFDWSYFIHMVKQDLLLEYLTKVWQLDLTVGDFETEDDRVAFLRAEIEKLATDRFDDIQIDLTKVRQLSTKPGVQRLILIANNSNQQVDDPYVDLNVYNRALFYRVNYHDIFQTAYVLNEVQPRKKKLRHGLKSVSVKNLMGKTTELATQISEYLTKNEKRGEACKVDSHDFGSSICFTAYPTNYPQDLLFFDGEQWKNEVNRPGFQITFLYYPEGGRLEIDCQGSWQKKHALMQIFNTAVLESDVPVPLYQLQFNLDKLVEDGFEIVIDPQDMGEEPQLKSIRLKRRHSNTPERYTIEIDNGTGVTPIRDAMNHRRLTLEYYEVDQAKISFKFPGLQKTGWVTVDLSLPDGNSPGSDEKDEKAQNYLEKWGVISREDESSPSTD